MTKTKKKVQKASAARSESEDEDQSTGLTPVSSPSSPSHGGTPEATSSSSPVLEAIKRMEHSINGRFDNLEASLEGLKAALAANTSRIVSLEATRKDHDSRVTELEKRCQVLTKQNTAIIAKLCDLEGRSRRQNIKIMGLPEKTEKGNPTLFVADFLAKLLGTEHFPGGIKVDRAHRIGAQSDRPRPMIARIHHDSVKERIIREVRAKGPLQYEGSRISIFQDLAADVIKDRKEFDDGRKKLREAGVRHLFLFPARFIFTHGGITKIFNSSCDAADYVDKHILAGGAAAAADKV